MKVAEVVQKYWSGKAVDCYDAINYIEWSKLKDTLLYHLRVNRTGIILDFGTGPGYLALILAKAGYKRIIGLDINKDMLSKARTKLYGYPVKLVRGDGLHLPLADNSIDAVVSRWVLWVMPDPEKAIEEMIRVLKPGGQILAFLSDFGKFKKLTWKKLLRFPLEQSHHLYLLLRFRCSPLRTKWFWKETKGNLPMYSPNKYFEIFNQKRLKNVEKIEEEYGTFCARLFYGGFKHSLLKGVKYGLLDSSDFKSEDWEINDFVKVLTCPMCHCSIEIISEGKLTCSGCRRTFSIEQDIPHLLPDANVML